MAIAAVESSGRPDQVNANGQANPERFDYGLMQIHGSTGRTIASRLGEGFQLSDLLDPARSIRYAAWLLRDNATVSGTSDYNDWISAYNWGLRSGRVVKPYPNPDYVQKVQAWHGHFGGNYA
jgi:soluble lytic murein transglycosylase-like protein